MYYLQTMNTMTFGHGVAPLHNHLNVIISMLCILYILRLHLKKKKRKSYISLTTYIFFIVFFSRFFLFLKSVHLLNKSNEQ